MKTTSDLVNDLSLLSTIPPQKINSLVNISNYCIVEAVTENLLNEKNIIEYNIGIGKLLIKIDYDCVKYKFIPSPELDKSIIDATKTKQNSLSLKLEKKLVDVIVNKYKDIV